MLVNVSRKVDSLYHTCLRTILFVILLTGLCPRMAAGQPIRFRDVTKAMQVPGWVVNGASCYGHGAFWVDISGDSLPDLYIANAVRQANSKLPETLYISHAGAAYTEEDGARGVSDAHGLTGTHGICFADYDNDGDLDFFNASTDDRIRLYRNKGNGFFEDVSNAAKLIGPKVNYPTYGEVGLGTRGIVAFDADNDGDMDLYAVNWGPAENKYLVPWETPPQPNEFYINNGDGTFSLAQDRGCTPVNPSNEGTQSVVALDIDEDGDMDLFVSHRNYAYLGKDAQGNDLFGSGPIPTPNDLFINDGTGRFTEVNIRERGLYSDSNDCNGTTFADYDNDGDLDAFVMHTESKKRYVRVYQNNGKGFFRNVSATTLIEQWGFTCFLFDADNDGDLDVFAPRTRSEAAFYVNNGDGTFTLQANTGVEVLAFDPRGGTIADFDGDGDLDIYFVDANKDANPLYSNRLFRNDTPTSNRWVKIWGSGPKGDLGAFGTKIWLYEKGGMEDTSKLIGYKQVMNAYGYLAQDDMVQHFGIGMRDSVDVKIQMLDKTVLKTRLNARTRFYFSKPKNITIVSGNGQSGVAGTRLAKPFQVQITDARGKAVQGAEVRFTAVSGGGTLVQSQPLTSDGRGMAQADYIIGNLAGVQRVTATLSGVVDGAVDFLITGINTGPARIELITGANQSAYAGQVLPDSIRIRVSDSIGAPQAEHPVHFELLAGNGKLKPGDLPVLDLTTNQHGMAAVAWQLGAVPGMPQTLQITSSASQTPLSGSPINVTATALQRPYIVGPPADLRYVSGDQQSAVAAQTLADLLTVQLVDSAGHPCDNYDILFEVVQGAATLDGAAQKIAKSATDGMAAAALRLGTQAGTYKVRARHASLAKEVYFTASALCDIPAILVKTGGDAQSGPPLQTLPKALAVQVTDQYGNAVTGQEVTFMMTSADGWINDLKSVTVATDSSGSARVFLRLGPTPGVYSATALSQYHQEALSGSPQVFSATVVSKPTLLHLASVDSTSGLAGQRLSEPLRIRITDQAGYPVPNHSATFLVRRGGGSFDNQTQATRLSDANGVVAVTPTLGGAIGKYNNVFEAQSYQEAGQPLSGSPIRFYVTAKKSLAHKMLSVSGNGSSGQAGEFLSQPLVVRIVDQQDQTVAGQDVLFEVVKGSGLLGAGQTSKVTVQSNSLGLAQISFRLGRETGAGKHQVHATATDGVDNLLNAPIVFTASAPYGQPDSVLSTVATITPVVADGIAECEISIQVVDAANNPVPGEWLVFLISGNGNRITPPEAPTDAQGMARAILRSTVAEIKTCRIYLTNKKIYLQKAPQIDFIAGTPFRLATLSGDFQSGIIQSALEKPIVVCVEDFNGNPVPGVNLTFSFPSGLGAVVPDKGVVTDAEGKARVTWILGPVNGQQQMQAQVAGSTITRTITATGTLPDAIRLVRHLGERQFSAPGGVFADSLTVQVVDGSGAPISGVEVTFAVLQGDATLSTTAAVRSDHWGLARVRLTAGYGIGAVKVRAMASSNDYVDFNAAVSTSVPERLSLVYGDSLTDRVGTIVYPLSVRVSDFFANPVANVPVQFTSSDVGIAFLDSQPMYTDDKGLVSARVQLGAQAGLYTIEARNSNLNGSPVAFHLFATASSPQNLIKYEGDQQSARALYPLPSPIKVKVIDSYGNGVRGQVVQFSVRAGGGQWYPNSILTDEGGLAATAWTLGLSGTQEMEVRCASLPGIQQFFTANLIANIPPVIRSIADTTITETHTLVFEVEAIDPDNGATTLQVENLPPGATFDALNSRLFIWRPDYTQAGTYFVTFIARDNNGGETKKVVTIRVRNLNRPPAIYAFQPESFYLQAATFKPYTFVVLATDQDNDPLQYIWRLNGRIVGQKDTLTLFTGTTLPPTFSLVATVKDRDDSVSQAWSVLQATGVAAREIMPQHNRLAQNYPNPFNPETTIQYELAAAQKLEIKIYNMSGQLVRTLFAGTAQAGYHHLRWDGRSDGGEILPSGVYQCLLAGETFRHGIKLVFLK